MDYVFFRYLWFDSYMKVVVDVEFVVDFRVFVFLEVCVLLVILG